MRARAAQTTGAGREQRFPIQRVHRHVEIEHLIRIVEIGTVLADRHPCGETLNHHETADHRAWSNV
jgi:hypothetical protein